MGQVSLPRATGRRQPASWPRRHRRRWLRANNDGAAAMMTVLPSLPRSVLTRLAEQMVHDSDINDDPPHEQEQAYE